MKKRGFTLVELLAVIAILAILIIIVLPNIMALFNQAKQNSFENEVKQIFKTAQQEWMKDSMFETKNIVYARCDEKCPRELQLSGRTNIDYYIEVDKAGNVIKLFATDDTYQYEYKGKGLKIEDIGNSKQIANLESSDILKVSCNKIEKDGKDVTNTQEKVPVTPKIYWALQDNDGDSINETLIISDRNVNGSRSGSFDGNERLYPDYNIPWINTGDPLSTSNLSHNVTTVKIEGTVAPVSTAFWFVGVGYNSSTFNADLSNLNLSNVSDMSDMFYSAGYKATTWSIGDISKWNTSNVTDMGGMFSSAGYNAPTFKFDLSNWDTSNVTDMSGMFSHAGYNAPTFNLNLSNWDTSNVIDMGSMFSSAGDSSTSWSVDGISSWDTSKVTIMGYMFEYAGNSAKSFNLDLSNWDTANVTDMGHMFYGAGSWTTTFNLNLSNWGTSNVTNMERMFSGSGYGATTLQITIPKDNGNGVDNTSSKLFGKDSSVYGEAPSGKTFTLAS